MMKEEDNKKRRWRSKKIKEKDDERSWKKKITGKDEGKR